MEPKRAYSAKGVLTALGKSLLYLLFFLAIQFLAGIIYAVIAVAGASLFHGEADAGSILAGTETAVLFAYLLTAAAILLWFRLRHKPLGEAAGLRRCSGWTAAFCAFAAVGLFVVLRLALALLGCNFFGRPAEHMTMIGITGTNGKTSSTLLLKQVLETCLGAKVGLIGTMANMIGQEIIPTERTTPESFELQALFARMRDAGCTHVVMEVSSHALVLDRVYGIRFAVGIFTNLSQDHLDFHHTMEAYCDAKAILFDRCDVGVYNADDPWHTRLLQNAKCPRLFSYGIHAAGADLRPSPCSSTQAAWPSTPRPTRSGPMCG